MIPFAQSSELPPPSATIESIAADGARTRVRPRPSRCRGSRRSRGRRATDDAGRRQARRPRGSRCRPRRSPVGDDERSRKCQARARAAQPVQRAIAENHARPEREVEWASSTEPKILHWPGADRMNSRLLTVPVEVTVERWHLRAPAVHARVTSTARAATPAAEAVLAAVARSVRDRRVEDGQPAESSGARRRTSAGRSRFPAAAPRRRRLGRSAVRADRHAGGVDGAVAHKPRGGCRPASAPFVVHRDRSQDRQDHLGAHRARGTAARRRRIRRTAPRRRARRSPTGSASTRGSSRRACTSTT